MEILSKSFDAPSRDDSQAPVRAITLAVSALVSESTPRMCLLSLKSETALPGVPFPRKHCIMLLGAWNNTWGAVNVDRISSISKEKVTTGYF